MIPIFLLYWEFLYDTIVSGATIRGRRLVLQQRTVISAYIDHP